MLPPIATYRLQLNSSFRFKDTLALAPYLAKLGVSHIYASPITRAKKGSSHGYDVVDPGQINPDLGTIEEFNSLIYTVKKLGMGWIQDIVPNHSSYSDENPMLADLMMRGKRSEYLRFFDIDWERPDDCISNPVLAPFLGEHYFKALKKGDVSLEFNEMGLDVRFHEARLPLSLESYATALRMGLDNAAARTDADPRIAEFLMALESIGGVSSSAEGRAIIRSLFELYSECEELRGLVDRSLERFNSPGGDLLDDLLSKQVFKLGFWRSAAEEINYRRFFTINDLISFRVEEQNVFDVIHKLVLDLVENGNLDGLRVDHIDGLHDPEEYLKRLRSRIGDRYLVVEKILSWGESLPVSWPVQGTTGYDFLNQVNGIFCDPSSADRFDRIYRDFAGQEVPFDEIVYNSKKLIIGRQMNGEIDSLARSLWSIARRTPQGRDMTLLSLRRAIVEVISLFPVYRTYASARGLSPQDRRYIEEAAFDACEKNSDLAEEIELLKMALMLDLGKRPDDTKEDVLRFAMRFQQFTGPIMAKGFEDTTLYVYNRLISQNTIGGSPASFGFTPDEFHKANLERMENWQHTMNATSTHDTKRGEDSRARINVLSEMPDEWERVFGRWSRLNEKKKMHLHGSDVPDGNEEYFFYQTILGALPFQEDNGSFCERIEQYVIKSLREAKVHSRWSEPDTSYEQALVSFLRSVLAQEESNEFLNEMLQFYEAVQEHGILNSLSQALIKMTSPGIPDIYQGTELWDLSFVDPDNRRQVDFEKRRVALEEICRREVGELQGLAADLLAARADGRVKLFLIHRALLARRCFSRVFGEGSYLPLQAKGALKDHVIAFARVLEGKWAVTVAPRLTAKLGPQLPIGEKVWGDAIIPMPDNCPRSWRDAITSKKIESHDGIIIGKALEEFPVALLLGGD